MPYGTVFLGVIGAFLGFFLGAACAVTGPGWVGWLVWPALTIGAAAIGFVIDLRGA